MIDINFKTPTLLGNKISNNVRVLRKVHKISMRRLSEMSGVSYGSIKRFEASGEISLTSLLKIALVLDCADDFENLFANSRPQSIQEIIDGNL
jgi:transcriptional regulator with XRE-family HTH domain